MIYKKREKSHDLLLQAKRKTFQIDTLIIMSGKILLYEVKNYDGDYFYEAGKLFKCPRHEIINPLHQLERSESLLRQLNSKFGIQTTCHYLRGLHQSKFHLIPIASWPTNNLSHTTYQPFK